MNTQPANSMVKHFARGQDDTGLVLAVVISLALHFGLVGVLIWKSRTSGRHPLPTAITVSLVSSLPTSRGGKQTKAPVARKPRTKTVVEKKKETPKPKTRAPQNDSKVGLKTKEKTTSKPPARKPETPSTRDAQPSRTQPKAGAGGAEESGISFELGHRGRNDLDLEEAKFHAYYRTILDEVDQRWAKGNLVGGTTTVSFRVARDGSVSDVNVSVSSGHAFLDGPAKRAVLGARLPPLPQGFEEEELIVTINFHYGES